MIPQRETAGRFVTAGLALLAPPATAQQAPAPVASSAPAPAWRLQISAGGTWYDNAYFNGGGAESTWSTTAQASLAHERGFRRGSFSLGGYGGVLYYPDLDGLNQATYGGNLGLAWAPTPRTQVRLAETFDRSNTRQLGSLGPEGLPLPTSGVNTATSTLGLTQGLSRRWQLGVEGTFDWRRYDDPALVGGEQLYASAQLSRGIGRHGAAYLGYGFSSAWFEAVQARTHVILAGGRREQEKGVGFELAGGGGYVESVGRWYPAGRAGLTARARRTSLALLYNRDFGQAFGYGRETIADLASATLGWTPARRLSVNAGYTYGYRRDPAGTGYRIRSSVASAGFGWGFTRDLALAAYYYWERNDTSGSETLAGSRVTASLSYGMSWK